VLVFDRSNLEDGSSFGNAGLIVPSHLVPLAAPGMMAKGFGWMFDRKSPFYVKPRFSLDLLRWGWLFYRHANQHHVLKSAPALKELSLFSKTRYQQLARELDLDFGYSERGLLMVYQSGAAEKEEEETAHLANRHGVTARMLSAAEVQALEPDVTVNVRGGVFYPGDAHLTPHQLVGGLIDYLKQQGVQFLTSTAVSGFQSERGRVSGVVTSRGNFPVDELVLAAGCWSGQMARQLRLTLPVQAGKGYSITVPDVPRNVRIPSILLEARVAITPMGRGLRMGGTMEIAGLDRSVNLHRVRGIVEAVPRYYPELVFPVPSNTEVWHGLRPCSPDGLPYIGRLASPGNVLVAAGHGMMGLSLAPGTGALIADLINQNPLPMEIGPFDPARFGVVR